MPRKIWNDQVCLKNELQFFKNSREKWELGSVYVRVSALCNMVPIHPKHRADLLLGNCTVHDLHQRVKTTSPNLSSSRQRNYVYHVDFFGRVVWLCVR